VNSGDLRAVTDDAAIEGCPRWSPDGRRIAFHSDAGGSNRLWLADADGSGLRLAGPALGELTNPVWAPDSLSLVAWDRRATGLRLVRLPEGRRASSENLASPPHPFTPVDWSPDGTQIAGTAAGNLWLYVVASRTYEPLVPGTAPAWLATSRRLLFASEGRLMMLDLPSRYTREILALPDLHLDSPVLSPDDRHLYFNQNATEANLWLLTLK
jgi:dipeptidyl aminopeptidase/acylaminoacyl peptidase